MLSPPAPDSFPFTGSQTKRGPIKDSVRLYAVQCYECHKWRTVPTKEEFEKIRENFIEEPWHCSKRPDCSCEEPADIEYDNSRIWVIDKPNIPKPPPETERLLIMRRDYTKMDTYYVMPNGKRARCTRDVDNFLEEHPEYKERISSSSFCFTTPRIVEETVSENSAWRAAKAKKQEKEDSPSDHKRNFPGSKGNNDAQEIVVQRAGAVMAFVHHLYGRVFFLFTRVGENSLHHDLGIQ